MGFQCGSELAREGVGSGDDVLTDRVHIRCCGNGCLGFRPYGDSLFLQTPKKSKQKNACSCVRPARWGSGSLRCGIDPGAAPPVCFAAPPLAVFGCAKRSLRSHPRINPSTQPSDVARGSRSRSRATAELALILEWGGFAAWGVRLLNCRSQLAGDGGLTADQSLPEYTGFKLWERACSRRRPDSSLIHRRCTQPLWEPGLPAMAA
jgi:hypothetical protein